MAAISARLEFFSTYFKLFIIVMKNSLLIGDICGGLGNQMFQYAAYKSLCITTSRDLVLAIDSFQDYPLYNGYELERVFGIKAKLADRNISEYLGLFSNTKIRKLLRKLPKFFRPKWFICEPTVSFSSNNKIQHPKVYAHGYWQGEKFFSSHQGLIRNEFEFTKPLPQALAPMAKQIVGVNSISIHVRRGDYVSNSKANKFHGLCTIEYYKKAVNLMNQHVSEPFYFIFTDDPVWAKETITPILKNVMLVEGNVGPNSYVDMQLMSLCKHNIIANSTFSWWGAWLNKNKEKTVIAPSRWFVDKKNHEVIVPSSWVKL